MNLLTEQTLVVSQCLRILQCHGQARYLHTRIDLRFDKRKHFLALKAFEHIS
jgi:hypothetical protein